MMTIQEKLAQINGGDQLSEKQVLAMTVPEKEAASKAIS